MLQHYFFKKKIIQLSILSRSEIPLKDAIHIPVDLSNSGWHEDTDNSFKSLLKEADQISLIHNASKMQSDNVEKFDLNELRNVLEVNLVGPSILNRMVIPYMKKGSSIIYVGSTLSEKAVPQMASYVTTKHGMIGFNEKYMPRLVLEGLYILLVYVLEQLKQRCYKSMFRAMSRLLK